MGRECGSRKGWGLGARPRKSIRLELKRIQGERRLTVKARDVAGNQICAVLTKIFV